MAWAVAFPREPKKRELCRRMGWKFPDELGLCSMPCCACGLRLALEPESWLKLLQRNMRLFCPFCAERRPHVHPMTKAERVVMGRDW